MTHPKSSLLIALASCLAAGCAGTGSAARDQAAAVGGEAAPPLESVRGSLTSAEDSLVLDLVLGYRARTEGGGDAETLRRARNAQQQLEYMLRRGGVKDRGTEARVVTVDGDRLTLGETVNQLSAALLRHTAGTAWRPEVERAREIQRRRPDLSTLVEDAEWVLALAAALEDPRGQVPADAKAKLRLLHESYAARAPHAGIAAQVNALLPAITDDGLRRELKKLANRSWERERRAASVAPAAPGAGASPKPFTPPPPQPARNTLPAATVAPVTPSTPPTTAAPAAPGPSDSLAPAGPENAAADTLTTPERFCAERRADAAQAFAQARASADTGARTRQLQRSLDLLDECITRFPGSPEAAKARTNRDRVQQELKR